MGDRYSLYKGLRSIDVDGVAYTKHHTVFPLADTFYTEHYVLFLGVYTAYDMKYTVFAFGEYHVY